MLQVRVRKLAAEDYYIVEFRRAPWFLLWAHSWLKYKSYDTLPKALSVAHEIKNPTIINITKDTKS